MKNGTAVLLVVEGIGGDDSDFAGAIYPSLLRQATRLVGEQDAADLVHDGFAAWYGRRLEAYDPGRMRAYIGKFMRSAAVNRATRPRDLLDRAASIEVTPWLT